MSRVSLMDPKTASELEALRNAVAAMESKMDSSTASVAELEELRTVVAALDVKLDRLLGAKTPRLTEDDLQFLVWMTGFTAGASLDRDGERGERIFARCREIKEKLFGRTQEGGGNGS
jgi:hypothetical protein